MTKLVKCLVVLAMLMVVGSASAQSSMCEACRGDFYFYMSPPSGWVSWCEEVYGNEEGQAGCSVVWTDSHNSHCVFSGGACMTYTPPPPPPVDPCQDGYQSQACSPVVINLANGAWSFSGADDPVAFDVDVDGVKELRAWPARGSRIAFLVMDMDGDGMISDGREWFGDWRPFATVHRNGFARLDDFDSDHDGAITPFDQVWSRLQLWLDANHDGVSQPDELSSLDANEIEEVGFAYHETQRADRDGVAFRYQSYVRIGGRREPTYDVLLKRFH